MVPVNRISTFVALGSSSTCGVGASKPESGYVALLERALKARAPLLETVNLGRAGAGFTQFIGDWPAVARLCPTIVTVLPFSDFATSPIPKFEQDCRALFDLSRALWSESRAEGRPFRMFCGDLRIDPEYIGGGSDRTGPGYKPAVYAMLTEKNATVAALAATNPAVAVVPVIDQNAIHPEWIAPGGHPNDLGHGYLAGCFRRAIDEWIDSLQLPLSEAGGAS